MDGLLALWKERGMTSHDCVYKVRKILATKKVGHSGTLDPDVDGVLPLGIGKGTKMLEYMVESSKTYQGQVELGQSTTTQDGSGDILSQAPVTASDLNKEQVDRVLSRFIGEVSQVPPMYSAVRVKGRRLYDYARKNEAVDRPKRQVVIQALDRTSDLAFDPMKQTASFSFRVVCSKGTYVRTLAEDIARELGYPGYMSDLTRLGSGGFTKEDCLTLNQLEDLVNQGQVADCLEPIERALSHLPSQQLSSEEWSRVKHGALLSRADYAQTYPLVLYYQNQAVAIYQAHPEKPDLLKPKKVLRTEM